jgi:hypothetical protein
MMMNLEKTSKGTIIKRNNGIVSNSFNTSKQRKKRRAQAKS